ncbi:uncharacterized protein LOC107267450 isoform X2 [Cephus cinctus]|nr:uncharacterized protein LOC107267450 isoform X2 [Cephus cinctus]
MKRVTLFIILSLAAVDAQLNFDGNPLTDDNVYTAEESHFSERSARKNSLSNNENEENVDSYLAAAKSSQAEHPQKIYPVDVKESLEDTTKDTFVVNQRQSQPNINQSDYYQNIEISVTPAPENKIIFVTPRSELAQSRLLQSMMPQSKLISYRQQTQESPMTVSDVALNSFLNSKTLQESQQALEYFLKSRQLASQVVQPRVSEIVLPQQLDQQQQAIQQNYNIGQQLANPLDLQGFSNPTQSISLSELTSKDIQGPYNLSPLNPHPPVIHARNDFYRPTRYPGYRRPVRRYNVKPFHGQSRIGPGPFYKGVGPPGRFPSKPIEVIYTKPPGFGHKSPYFSNPPVPYEDASAWFPDADHPPPDKNIYWSQLYAQSYDPHYYNYIAKTGKIKPHLYGKFDKHDDGLWAELYKNFKRHGLKNIMTPTFLLGMTIPAITLMLSALVQKRSLGRSSDSDLVAEEQIKEYLERVQKAIKCYDRDSTDSQDEDTEC